MTVLKPTKERDASNLDSKEELRFLVLRSSSAEELFAKRYFDLDLDPHEVLILKLLRGRFLTPADFWAFIAEKELEWIADNGILSYPGGKVNEIMLFAGGGKTTLLVIDAVMECIENPNSRNQAVFKNQNEAFACSGAIRQALQSPRIVSDFGQMKPTDKELAWSDKSLVVANREITDIRDNYEFYGTNSSDALGKRADRVLADDIETPDTSRTEEGCRKLIEWFNTGPMTAPRPRWAKDVSGNAIVPATLTWPRNRKYWTISHMGTIFHPKGLHSYLANLPMANVVKVDCWKNKGLTVPSAPQMMGVDELEQEKKNLSILVFNKRYRNIAYNPEEMAFQEVWVRGGEEYVHGTKVDYPGCLDETRSIGEYDEKWDLYLGFDPASGSKSRWAAYSAWVVLGHDPKDAEKYVYVIDYAKTQEDFDRMLDRLLDGNPNYGIKGFMDEYPIRYATVEKNAVQAVWTNNDRTKPYVLSGRIKPAWTGLNKLDEEMGVFGMGTMVANGRLRIPYREASDKEVAQTFVDDLVTYPKVKSDLVMALWLAYLPIQSDSSHLKTGYSSKRGHQGWLSRTRAQ